MTHRTGAFKLDRQDVPDLSMPDLPPPAYPEPSETRRQPEPAEQPGTGSMPHVRPTAAKPARQKRAPVTPAAPPAETPDAEPAQMGEDLRLAGVRIPTQLYDAVQEWLAQQAERPSYAQLVTWACEDQPDKVADGVRRTTAADRRRPRGSVRAGATTPLTLRFLTQELQIVDAIREHVTGVPATKITRTATVISAMQVAIGDGTQQVTSSPDHRASAATEQQTS